MFIPLITVSTCEKISGEESISINNANALRLINNLAIIVPQICTPVKVDKHQIYPRIITRKLTL